MFSETFIERLRGAKIVAVLTGAGVSAESGVPTFRGEEGLWKKYRPEELATFESFMRNPQLVWEWYNFRRDLIHKVKPNPGHYALAEMEKLFPEFHLITQNIDNLHRRAGNQRIYELHGNIMRNRCVDCNKQYEAEDFSFDPAESLPRCECGGLIRPDVVWFGEMLPAEQLRKSFSAARRCDVFISIGTSAIVQPAGNLPLEALDAGAYVAEINPERTVISNYLHETILGKSGEILPKLLEKIKS